MNNLTDVISIQPYLEKKRAAVYEQRKLRGDFVIPPKYITSTKQTVDEIAAHLPRDYKLLYKEAIPLKQRLAYNQRLKRTLRWQRAVGDVEQNPPGWHDNDLDHVCDLQDILTIMEMTHPKLINAITDGNRERSYDLRTNFIMHDGGETVVGDLITNHPDAAKNDGLRHKRKESKAAHLLIGQIENKHVRKYVRDLFIRNEEKDPADKLMMGAHLIDKHSSSRVMANTIIPYNLSNFTADQLANQLYFTITKTLNFADLLDAHLDGAAKAELKNFVHAEILGPFLKIDHPVILEVIKAIRMRFSCA